MLMLASEFMYVTSVHFCTELRAFSTARFGGYRCAVAMEREQALIKSTSD
jgi:hypothetical protein